MFRLSVISPVATFQLQPATAIVDEASAYTITLSTTGVQNGQLIPYTITGVTQVELDGAPLSGNFVVQNNTATKTFTAQVDANKNMVLTLNDLGVTASVTINNQAPIVIGDPYWSSVVFMSNFDTLVDEKGHTLTSTYGATISPTIKKFGTNALACSGSYGADVTSGLSDFDFGTGDFTIELWVYLTAATGGYLKPYEQVIPGHYPGIRFGDGGFGTQLQVSLDMTSFSTLWSTSITQASCVGVWKHLAFTRESGKCRFFVDGTLQQLVCTAGGGPVSFFEDYASITGTSSVRIGTSNMIIDDTRVTKGVARYTSSFTAPTTAFSSSSPPGYDPYWNNVVLSMNMDGANNGVVFTDAKSHTITAVGDVKTATTQTKYGPTSAHFDGIGDRLSTAASTDFTFGTGDFTVEMYLYKTTAGINQTAVSKWDSGATGWGVMWYGNDKIAWLNSGGVSILADTTAFPTNQWVHVAIARQSGQLRMFIDGVQKATVAHTANYSSATAALVIGALDTSGNFSYTGYIDDLRITKGVARYTTSFTPPAEAHAQQ